MALATYNDYQRAAEALGKPYHSFVGTVSTARKQFLRLWHEHETPSEVWGREPAPRRNLQKRHGDHDPSPEASPRGQGSRGGRDGPMTLAGLFGGIAAVWTACVRPADHGGRQVLSTNDAMSLDP